MFGSKSVNTSATLIVSANGGRRNLTIHPVDVDIFIGPDASVTASTGIPVFAGSTRDRDKIPEGYTGAVYGVTASGTSDVRYWEVLGS